MNTTDVNPKIYKHPENFLKNIIRFDTTNPPGNEKACVEYIDAVLKSTGFETKILAKDPERPNLIARLKGRGDAAPFLLYGHVDVVPAVGNWDHEPFKADEADGYIWGRGALDMKGGISMIICALLRAKDEGIVPAGDIILAVLSDEEAGGEYGAKYLAENHAAEFEGVQYAIGEFGGIPLSLGGKKFYAIQVAEKRPCWMRMIIPGKPMHSSSPIRDGAMAKLGYILSKLNENRLPVHIIPIVRQMIETACTSVSPEASAMLSQLLDTSNTDHILDALGPKGLMLDAMLHNTVNATMIEGGTKINIAPSKIVAQLDGRLLPGYSPEDMQAEIRDVVGDKIFGNHIKEEEKVKFEMVRNDPDSPEADMKYFDMLAGILHEAEPDSPAIPLLLQGSTDGRFFSELGIQTYGFLPMNLPEDLNFLALVHGANERIPIESLEFGTNAIYKVIKRYE